MKLLISYL